MTVEPTTVYNFPQGAHNDYAKAKQQEAFDKSLLSDAQFVPDKTTTSVTQPSLFTEFNTLFLGLPRSSASLARFTSPSQFANLSAGLFSHVVIPRLGTLADVQASMDTLESFASNVENPEDKEAFETLSSFFQAFQRIIRNLERVNGERKRYQRG